MLVKRLVLPRSPEIFLRPFPEKTQILLTPCVHPKISHSSCTKLESASPICSKEATYPGHMLISFWCDSFLRDLHKKLVTVLYFSIINVFWLLNLCGTGGDSSFALGQI